MAGQLAGKVGLVTGAASGIGRATALAFAKEGAKVTVTDIEVEGGKETVRLIHEVGGDAIFIKTDVTQEIDVKASVEQTVKKYGRLDCVLNNAGISGEPGLTADCSTENWNRMIAINLTGVFLGMKYQIPQMLKQGSGAIVNMSSMEGIIAHSLVPAYVASKHGVIGLTKSTALGYIKNNIRVNAICPGNTLTPIWDPVIRNQPENYQAMLAATPIGRLGRPEEIANAIVWLCSDAASYCSGHALVLDGCYTIQ